MKSSASIKHNRIALIGFMGTGKSAVSEVLSKKSGFSLIDIDKEIEKVAGKTITEIFDWEGESFFRELETDALKKVIIENKVIISCGGGIVKKEENRMLLSANTYIIWLKNKVEISLARCSGSSRPLLNTADSHTAAQKLYSEREPIYASIASLVVDTEGKTIEEVAEEILLNTKG